jgi:hypothetical protein
MNQKNRRPYLSDRRCGRCLVQLETSERREGGWLYVTFHCPGCGFKQVVTFSPTELAEWERRGQAVNRN